MLNVIGLCIAKVLVDASKWQTKRGASQVSEDLKIESVDVYYNPNVSWRKGKGFPV